jgi:hypothetical protein
MSARRTCSSVRERSSSSDGFAGVTPPTLVRSLA